MIKFRKKVIFVFLIAGLSFLGLLNSSYSLAQDSGNESIDIENSFDESDNFESTDCDDGVCFPSDEEYRDDMNGSGVEDYETNVESDDYISIEGVVEEIVEERVVEDIFGEQMYQLLKVRITKGEDKGEVVEIENGAFAQADSIEYKEGDKISIILSKDMELSLIHISEPTRPY